jgi:hypothetical protein
MDTSAWIGLGLWGLTVAALAGQNWANTRSLRDNFVRGQSETNAHLKTLNDKTYQTFGDTQELNGIVSGLPCRKGSAQTGDCQAG